MFWTGVKELWLSGSSWAYPVQSMGGSDIQELRSERTVTGSVRCWNAANGCFVIASMDIPSSAGPCPMHHDWVSENKLYQECAACRSRNVALSHCRWLPCSLHFTGTRWTCILCARRLSSATTPLYPLNATQKRWVSLYLHESARYKMCDDFINPQWKWRDLP